MYNVLALSQFDTLLVSSAIAAASHNGSTNTDYVIEIECRANGHGVPQCFYTAWLTDALTEMEISGRVMGLTDMDGLAIFTLSTDAVLGTAYLHVTSGLEETITPIVIGSLGADDTLTVEPPEDKDFAALAKSTPHIVTITTDSGDPLVGAYFEASLVGAPAGTALSGTTSGVTGASGEKTFTLTTGTVVGAFSLVVRSGLLTTTTACEVVS